MITLDQVPPVKGIKKEDPRNATIAVKVTQKTHDFFKKRKDEKSENLALKAVVFAHEITEQGYSLEQVVDAIMERERLETTLDYIIKTAQPHLPFDLFAAGQEYFNNLVFNAPDAN